MNTDMDIGVMLQAQMAISYPFSKTGQRFKKVSDRMIGNHGLSVVTCFWLGKKALNVR